MPTTASTTATRSLAELGRGAQAVVSNVRYQHGSDAVAARLEDLGFVPGESLRVIALGPLGGDPMVVQVGFTRFALRRSEAARIIVATSGNAVATDTAGTASV